MQKFKAQFSLRFIDFEAQFGHKSEQNKNNNFQFNDCIRSICRIIF